MVKCNCYEQRKRAHKQQIDVRACIKTAFAMNTSVVSSCRQMIPATRQQRSTCLLNTPASKKRSATSASFATSFARLNSTTPSSTSGCARSVTLRCGTRVCSRACASSSAIRAPRVTVRQCTTVNTRHAWRYASAANGATRMRQSVT